MGYIAIISTVFNVILVFLFGIYVDENERKLLKMEHSILKQGQTVYQVEKEETKLESKGTAYIRWGKTKCDGEDTETIYSGQAGGGHYSHKGASVNYICLPNDPDIAQPLKSHDSYAYLYGAEYEVYNYNKPEGIKTEIGHHDVACAYCYARGKTTKVIIPGKKTCYKGWTKEYDGYLMAGYHGHNAGSEYACMDKKTESIPGGSQNLNGKLFYPAKTQCGSLQCPPYKHDTEVLCVVCTK